MALTLGGGLLLWRYPSTPPVEVTLATPAPVAGELYVGGAVVSPGLYPWRPGETVEEALQAAGGLSREAQPGKVTLLVPGKGLGPSPQKVNLNTAEPWLLQALPGIGPHLAQAIVSYREENGPFRRIEEVTQVPGIGSGLLSKIRELITVEE